MLIKSAWFLFRKTKTVNKKKVISLFSNGITHKPSGRREEEKKNGRKGERKGEEKRQISDNVRQVTHHD